ncbi:MAG: S8 family serine peptidase [Pyrinomonadaceae bacterium]
MSANANPTSQPTIPAAIFEGYYIQMVMPDEKQRAQEIVDSVLGTGWRLMAIRDTNTDFEVTMVAGGVESTADILTIKEAWENTYRLRSTPGLVNAEPLFGVPVVPGRGSAAVPADFSAEVGFNWTPPDIPESNDALWSLKQMRIFEAWASAFPAPGKLPGEGVIVGHPDTGYRRHPEIIGNLLAEQGHDFVDNDNDAQDGMQSGTLLFPGHGTGTASVIISPKDSQGNYPSGKAVSGIAPGAKLIPCRVAPTVVLLSPTSLATAIEFVTDQGAHVISMSMGTGFFNQRLLAAVLYSQKRGVIVCAAAGNYVGYVVWPAAYEEVIAVAACNARRDVWWASSHGSAVDVTAPGESVWRADVTQQNGQDVYDVQRGSGTSYAVAAVAGIAALWLSKHGRDHLVQRYGAEKIPFIFNHILRTSCEQVPAWFPGQYGAGLVNAEKVLAAPLPNDVDFVVGPTAFALNKNAPLDSGNMETFVHLFEPVLNAGNEKALAVEDHLLARLRIKLAELLGTNEGELTSRLKEVGQELAFHLAANPDLYKNFAAALSSEVTDPSALTTVEMVTPAHMEAVRNLLPVKGASEALMLKTKR